MSMDKYGSIFACQMKASLYKYTFFPINNSHNLVALQDSYDTFFLSLCTCVIVMIVCNL